jgi:outer membrane lipoprotein-sorting protein
MRAVAAVLLVLLVGTSALAQKVTGDVRAWEEVKAALDRLEALRTYRMRMAPEMESGGQRLAMTMVTETVKPDRHRMVMETPEYTAEVIVVGRQTAQRFVSKTSQPAVPQPSLGIGTLIGAFDPLGLVDGLIMQAVMNRIMQTAMQRPTGWRCQTLEEVGRSGPVASEPEVEVTRLPDATVGGVPTGSTACSGGSPGSPPAEQRLYVGAADGMPRRTEMVDQGKVVMATDYQDFNAPITIELPRCT